MNQRRVIMPFFQRLLSALIVLLAVSTISPAYAAGTSSTADLSNLTDAERFLVLQTIEGLKAKSDVSDKPAKDQANSVKEWAELGTAIGTAFVNAADKIGTKADEFLKTGVGKITVAIIVWKLMKSSILGIIFFMVFLPGWWYFTKKFCLVQEETIVQKVKLKGEDDNVISKENEIKRVYVSENDISTWRVLMFIVLIIICGTGFVIM